MCIGERMVSLINIHYGIKENTYRFCNFNTNQLLYLVGMSSLTKSLHIQVIIMADTSLNHLNTKATLPRHEGSCMVYRPELY